MLALYSHILVQLKETTKRIKSARKREMDQKDNLVSLVPMICTSDNTFLTNINSDHNDSNFHSRQSSA